MGDGVRRILAWGVHVFTACGAVAGTLALIAILEGAWSTALLLMLLGLFIDAVDGMLARRLEVRRLAARIDGRRLDDIVDYLNYVIVPVVFLVATGLLPHWAWTIPPVLASAYGFSQVAAKTEDHYFLGFPSYWNVVAIYSFLLDLEPLTCTLWVVVLSGLVFVPWRYVYPTQLRSHRAATLALSLACLLLVGVSILAPDSAETLHLVEISLLFPVWYMWLSWHLGGFRLRAG